MYSARINLISGDCKKETAEEHAQYVIQPVLDGIKRTAQQTGIRVVSVASDGEARRGSALVLITFKRLLSPTSPIYPLLSPLQFMNLHVGDDDLTCDKDWKHVFKRLRNLLLRDRGVVIEETKITPSIIKEHLRDAGKSKEHINAVTNPEDLQDVKLAFDLLYDIWSLPPLPENSKEPTRPGFQNGRDALRVLGRLFYHLVYAYICIDLSLSDQLAHLSAAAHLLFVLYREKAKHFIPSLLYIDITLMIKNAYFCVAKAKIDTPDDSFFLILLGTDRLEIHFGILRTVVGTDSNVDILQISERTSGLVDIADILAKHPEWDRGPRRMQLPALNSTSEEVPRSADHLSPKHLKGDYALTSVTLLTCWRRGRKLAEDDYSGVAGMLKAAMQEDSVEMLAPKGVLLVNVPLDVDDVDESSESLALGAEEESGSASMGMVEIEGETLVDVENELQGRDPLESSECAKIVSTVNVDGKETSKSKVLSQLQRYLNAAGSTDRLKRVQELKRYTTIQQFDLEPSHNMEDDILLIHDIFATLIHSEDRLWLAIGEVTGIRYDGQALDRIGHHILAENATKISFQLVGLKDAASDAEKNGEYDWKTYRMTSRSFEVFGKCIEPLNPSVVAIGGCKPFYTFNSDVLIATTALLAHRIAPGNLKSLPRMASNVEYPYSNSKGQFSEMLEIRIDSRNSQPWLFER